MVDCNHGKSSEKARESLEGSRRSVDGEVRAESGPAWEASRSIAGKRQRLVSRASCSAPLRPKAHGLDGQRRQLGTNRRNIAKSHCSISHCSIHSLTECYPLTRTSSNHKECVMALVLSRKPLETLVISGPCVLYLTQDSSRARIAIEARPEVEISRGEQYGIFHYNARDIVNGTQKPLPLPPKG